MLLLNMLCELSTLLSLTRAFHTRHQWFSTFLTLGPISTVFHVLVTSPPAIKLFSLLLRNCNFATGMIRTVNICVFQWS